MERVISHAPLCLAPAFLSFLSSPSSVFGRAAGWILVHPTRNGTSASCSGSMASGSPGKSRLLPSTHPFIFPLQKQNVQKLQFCHPRKYRLYIANANEVHIKNTVSRHVEICFEVTSSLFIYNWTHSQLDHPSLLGKIFGNILL